MVLSANTKYNFTAWNLVLSLRSLRVFGGILYDGPSSRVIHVDNGNRFVGLWEITQREPHKRCGVQAGCRRYRRHPQRLFRFDVMVLPVPRL